jgi:hypothetical protein
MSEHERKMLFSTIELQGSNESDVLNHLLINIKFNGNDLQ